MCYHEFMKQIPGFDGRYSISEHGVVYSSVSQIEMKSPVAPNGYKVLNLRINGSTIYCYIHNLVALTFHGVQPTGTDLVRHLDGNPLNNHKDNLKWGTHKENAEDKEKHGRHPRGDGDPKSILTEDRVWSILVRYRPEISTHFRRDRRLMGLPTQAELAQEHGVRTGTIEQIIQGKNWKHVLDRYWATVVH